MLLQNRIVVAIIVLTVLVAGFFFVHDQVLYAIGDALVVQDQLEHADIIHVIAGEDYRTEYAIQLYKNAYADRLFFTGGWCIYHHYFHGQHAQQIALEEGVPPEAIAFDETTVRSTYDEALRLKEYVSQHSSTIHSVIVVSDPFHMWRARWIYRKIFGPDIKIIMAPVPFELSKFQRRWWADIESTRMVRDEYVKILYYFARFQWSSGRLQEWLATLDPD